MATKKPPKAGAKTYERQNEYHRNRQPKSLERWTNTQFQQWVREYGYPEHDAPTLPYDVAMIAEDLKCHTSRVYTYWRGNDGHKNVTVPPGVVALCKALLEIKRLKALLQ